MTDPFIYDSKKPAEPLSQRVKRGLAAGAVAVVVIAVPNAVIANPLVVRDTPVRPWELPTMIAAALLTAVWFGIAKPEREDRTTTLPFIGVMLAFFAVSCPLCNKLVVDILGSTAARTQWGPMQPVVAAASVILLSVAVVYRWRQHNRMDDSSTYT